MVLHRLICLMLMYGHFRKADKLLIFWNFWFYRCLFNPKKLVFLTLAITIKYIYNKIKTLFIKQESQHNKLKPK
jgi:hypothetical protein